MHNVELGTHLSRTGSCLVILIALTCSFAVQAEKKLFESEAPLALTITAPFSKIHRERDKSKIYPNTIVSYQNESGLIIDVNIGLKVRGNFRLKKLNCTNPPLKLVIDKSARKTIFSKQGELKLVVPCKRNAKYQQYILLEYLSYKLYNILSQDSYKVRLAEITFVDSGKKNKAQNYTGFFIEPHKRLAKRLAKSKIDVLKVNTDQLNSKSLAIQNLFQYMIGNTDFSTLIGPVGRNCCHNNRLFKGEQDSLLTAIPYDFDSTGLVDAPYARPSAAVKIPSVRSRRYRGFCEQNRDIRNAIPLFNQQRSEIENLFKETQGLSDLTRKRSLKYLDKFYKTINSTALFEKHIIERCR
jgi:hypothetical protein